MSACRATARATAAAPAALAAVCTPPPGFLACLYRNEHNAVIIGRDAGRCRGRQAAVGVVWVSLAAAMRWAKPNSRGVDRCEVG